MFSCGLQFFPPKRNVQIKSKIRKKSKKNRKKSKKLVGNCANCPTGAPMTDHAFAPPPLHCACYWVLLLRPLLLVEVSHDGINELPALLLPENIIVTFPNVIGNFPLRQIFSLRVPSSLLLMCARQYYWTFGVLLYI